jgi:hypothetical protein
MGSWAWLRGGRSVASLFDTLNTRVCFFGLGLSLLRSCNNNDT